MAKFTHTMKYDWSLEKIPMFSEIVLVGGGQTVSIKSQECFRAGVWPSAGREATVSSQPLREAGRDPGRGPRYGKAVILSGLLTASAIKGTVFPFLPGLQC